MNIWSTNRSKAHKRRTTVNVLASASAVDAGLKPGYLFDEAFFSSDEAVEQWLSNVCDDVKPNCRFSLLNIENQLFLVDVDRLRDYMLDIIAGDEDDECGPVLIDVSRGLRSPKFKLKADSKLIIKECAQLIFNSCAKSSSAGVVIGVVPPDSLNRTTLYGVILGYPVIYWYKDDVGGDCLCMIPLIVETATVSIDIYRSNERCRRDCTKTSDIYSFSIPQILSSDCQKTVAAWRSRLVKKFDQKRTTYHTIGALNFNSKAVELTTVCL